MKIRKILKKPELNEVNIIILYYNLQKEENLNNKRYPNVNNVIFSFSKNNSKKSLNPVQLKKSFLNPIQKSVANIPDRKEREREKEKDIIISVTKSQKDKEREKEKDRDVIISMNKDHKEVLNFLKELNMVEFYDNFINNGIFNKEKLLYLNNDNLKLINIPYAYRLRFLKKLKELENLHSMKKSINEKGRLSKIKLKKGQNDSKYEEIFIPKEEDDKEVSDEEMRKTFTQAIYDFQKTHSKFDFENGNNNSHNEDINENIDDMSVNSSNNLYDTKTSSMNNNKVSTDINTNNSKVEDGNENGQEQIEIGEYVEHKNNDGKNNVKELLPLNSKKVLCYQCWNIILKDCIVRNEKPFCSEKCYNIYDNENYTKCKTCSKKLKIVNCLPSFNNRNIYYCSLSCLEKLEPERKNWMKKNLIDDDEKSISSSVSNVSEKQVDILDL